MQFGYRPFKLFAGDYRRIFDFAVEIEAAAVEIDIPLQDRVAEIKSHIERTGVAVASVGAMSCAMLGPDMEQSAHEQSQVRKAIAIARELGAPVVAQFAGHDPNKSIAENIEVFSRIYTPLAQAAEDHGVVLAFENCPMVGGTPRVFRNIAYCPAHWRQMFTAVSSKGVGLMFDIGHCPYVGLDAVAVIKEFAGRIVHVQVKDTALLPDEECDKGLLGGRPHTFCMPGKGVIDFEAIFAALREIGYHGYVTTDLHQAGEAEHHVLAEYFRGLVGEVRRETLLRSTSYGGQA
jgi:sugar phosphate isomerase/epimerase